MAGSEGLQGLLEALEWCPDDPSPNLADPRCLPGNAAIRVHPTRPTGRRPDPASHRPAATEDPYWMCAGYIPWTAPAKRLRIRAQREMIPAHQPQHLKYWPACGPISRARRQGPEACWRAGSPGTESPPFSERLPAQTIGAHTSDIPWLELFRTQRVVRRALAPHAPVAL